MLDCSLSMRSLRPSFKFFNGKISQQCLKIYNTISMGSAGREHTESRGHSSDVE